MVDLVARRRSRRRHGAPTSMWFSAVPKYHQPDRRRSRHFRACSHTNRSSSVVLGAEWRPWARLQSQACGGLLLAWSGAESSHSPARSNRARRRQPIAHSRAARTRRQLSPRGAARRPVRHQARRAGVEYDIHASACAGGKGLDREGRGRHRDGFRPRRRRGSVRAPRGPDLCRPRKRMRECHIRPLRGAPDLTGRRAARRRSRLRGASAPPDNAQIGSRLLARLDRAEQVGRRAGPRKGPTFPPPPREGRRRPAARLQTRPRPPFRP